MHVFVPLVCVGHRGAGDGFELEMQEREGGKEGGTEKDAGKNQDGEASQVRS